MVEDKGPGVDCEHAQKPFQAEERRWASWSVDVVGGIGEAFGGL